MVWEGDPWDEIVRMDVCRDHGRPPRPFIPSRGHNGTQSYRMSLEFPGRMGQHVGVAETNRMIQIRERKNTIHSSIVAVGPRVCSTLIRSESDPEFEGP